MKSFFILFVIVFFGVLAAGHTPAHAQLSPDSLISLSATPSSPGPNETVRLELVSFGVALDRSAISWRINGEIASSGTGRKTFSATVGGAGEQTTISATITTPSGERVTKEVRFIPTVVDLLWEAPDAYTPPFYKGKAIPGSGAQIRVVALPQFTSQGRTLSPETLIYTWERNGRARDLNDQSGYGKHVITITNDFLEQTERIRVRVSSANGALSGIGQVPIPTRDPLPVIYYSHPLLGTLYERAIDESFSMTDTEATFIAEPYFFSAARRTSDALSFVWRVNGERAEDNEQKGTLVIRAAEGVAGQAPISLSISHTDNILQRGSKAFSLILEENRSSVNFGL